ncbi:MAG TPA: hypothetical protein VGE74_31785 [Gemmata sp.]
MADAKISALTALTAPDAADLVPVVDVSDTTDAPTGTTKKATVGALNGVLLATANTFTAAQTISVIDPATVTTTPILTIGHNSSSVPSAGFGSAIDFYLKSSTTDDRWVGRFTHGWKVATDASRSAYGLWGTVVGGLPLWAIGTASDVTGAYLGFLAKSNTPSKVQLGDVGTALVTFGLMSGTPTFAAATLTGTLPLTAIPAGVMRGYIDGLTLTKASATTVTVSIGTARDGADGATLYLSTATTKVLQSSGSWTAGTNNNGLDTGARAGSTWYHVFLISQANGANPDVLFSLSATAPTMPGSYTLKRRIGSVLTDGSGNIMDFVQYGDWFFWGVMVADVVVMNPGTGTVNRTLTVPTGVKVGALLTVGYTANTASDLPSSIMVTDLATADLGGSFAAGSYNLYSTTAAVNGGISGIQGPVWTNTSGQVRTRMQLGTAGTRLIIDTFGWIDFRGRDA